MVCLITGEKFAELLGKDPALLAKLGLDKVNADAAAAASAADRLPRVRLWASY